MSSNQLQGSDGWPGALATGHVLTRWPGSTAVTLGTSLRINPIHWTPCVMRLYQSKGLALALLLLLLCLLYWPGGQGGQAGRRQEQDRRLQEEQQEGGAITMAPSNFDPGSASFYQAGGAGSASSAQVLSVS